MFAGEDLPDALSDVVLKFCQENIKYTGHLSVHGSVTVIADITTTVSFFSKTLPQEQSAESTSEERGPTVEDGILKGSLACSIVRDTAKTKVKSEDEGNAVSSCMLSGLVNPTRNSPLVPPVPTTPLLGTTGGTQVNSLRSSTTLSPGTATLSVRDKNQLCHNLPPEGDTQKPAGGATQAQLISSPLPSQRGTTNASLGQQSSFPGPTRMAVDEVHMQNKSSWSSPIGGATSTKEATSNQSTPILSHDNSLYGGRTIYKQSDQILSWAPKSSTSLPYSNRIPVGESHSKNSPFHPNMSVGPGTSMDVHPKWPIGHYQNEQVLGDLSHNVLPGLSNSDLANMLVSTSDISTDSSGTGYSTSTGDKTLMHSINSPTEFISSGNATFSRGSYGCQRCGIEFDDEVTLTNHMRTHGSSKNRPYKCEQCGRGFSMRGNLLRHMKNHAGIKPFICTHCGKGFNVKSNMERHLRTHTYNEASHDVT